MREPCGAKTRNGGTCPNPPVNGAKRCRMHGGRTDKAKARAEAERIRKTLGDVPDDVDPAEALLSLVRAKFGEVAWLRQKVIEVGESGGGPGDHPSLTYGLTKHDEGMSAQGPIDQKTYEAAPNIWWRLLREAEDQLAKYSALALKAGVEKRQIELQETQALWVAQAINRVLDAMELTAEQQKRIPEVVPQVLRALPVEGGNK